MEHIAFILKTDRTERFFSSAAWISSWG